MLARMTDRRHHGLASTLAHHGPYTRADLDTMPDDGRRHELLDGALIVTPPPADRHQAIVVNLIVLLKQAASAELTGSALRRTT